MDPTAEEEGPASTDSLVLVRLRCLIGGVTPLFPAEQLSIAVGLRTAGVTGVSAGVGG